MSATISLPLGGKLHSFRLALAQLQELQGVCNAGPATIFARLMSAQPQAAATRRPDPDAYPAGLDDPDFHRDLNAYSILRAIGGDWRVEDVRETIRLGLIGAGASSTDAFVTVSRYVDQIDRFALVDNVGIAAAILHHALTAPEGEPAGKPPAGKTEAVATG